MKKTLVFSFLFFSAVPRVINYQGKLVDSAGRGINDTVIARFALFSDEHSISPLWVEIDSNVVVEKGLFNVCLGSIVPFPDSLDFGRQYWLEIQVNSEIIAPRKRLSSVPYAIRSAYADSALKASINLPRGIILMWYGSFSNVPEGWAPCDGGTYVAPNGELVVTPDLRDRFIVAAGLTYLPNTSGGNSSHTHNVNISVFSSSSAGDHSHIIDPPAVSTSSVGDHTHWIDPPNTSTNSAGTHSHTYSGQTNSASINCNYYTYNPDAYADVCDDHRHNYSGTTSSDGGHTHSVDIGGFSSGGAGAHSHSVDIGSFSCFAAGSHSHSIDPPPTFTDPANNIPPFYAVIFIMKL